jgi:hypothetical protein
MFAVTSMISNGGSLASEDSATAYTSSLSLCPQRPRIGQQNLQPAQCPVSTHCGLLALPAHLAHLNTSGYENAMTAIQPLNRFQSYLFPGERILWTGQPKQGLALSGKDALLIPFSLLWGGFAIFWNIGVWTFPDTGQSIDWFMRLWGLPFLVAGLYLIVGRFIHDAAIRKHLFYAVTEQRILVLRGLDSAKLKSVDIHRLPKLELSEHRDGTGTIEVDGDNSFFGSRTNGFGYWTPALSSATQFFRIDNPRKVYELIRNHSRA